MQIAVARALATFGAISIASTAAGCRKDPPKSDDPLPSARDAASDAVGDAASDASATRQPPADTTLRVVAEAPQSISLEATPDGRLFVLTNGILAYEAHEDGAVSLVAPLAVWSPVLSGHTALVGYGTAFAQPLWISSAGPNEVDLWFPHGAPSSLHVSSNGVEVKNRRPGGTVVSFRGQNVGLDRRHSLGEPGILVSLAEPSATAGAKGPPVTSPDPERRYYDITTTADGALVALPESPSSESVIWDRPDAPPRSVVIPFGARSPLHGCDFVRAFDKRTYAQCIVSGTPQHQLLFRLASDKSSWEAAFSAADPIAGSSSVDGEGALWNLPTGDASPKISRCASATADQRAQPGAACVEIDHGEWKPSADFASYGFTTTGSEWNEHGDYFGTLRFERGPATFSPPRIVSLVARSSHDVWAIARSDRVIDGLTMPRYLLVHSGPEPRARLHLPGEGDARVLVMNTEAPRTWNGQCDEIFVRLAGPLADDESAKKLLAEVTRALPPAGHQTKYGIEPWRWELVAGLLHDEPVTGVIVYRYASDAPRSKMEAAVRTLIEKLAKNPVDQPPAYCTLPVLDRVYAH